MKKLLTLFPRFDILGLTGITASKSSPIIIYGCAFIIGAVLFFFGKSLLATPTSLPQTFDDVVRLESGDTQVAAWFQDDGSVYCWGGSRTRTLNLPAQNNGESLTDYIWRVSSNLFTRELYPPEADLCQQACYQLTGIDPLTNPDRCQFASVSQWVVEQYRSYQTRPVKRIIDVNGVPTVDTSDTIGRINYGEPCAEEIFSGTSYMWRRVTIIYPDGTPIEGAAVCQRL